MFRRLEARPSTWAWAWAWASRRRRRLQGVHQSHGDCYSLPPFTPPQITRMGSMEISV